MDPEFRFPAEPVPTSMSGALKALKLSEARLSASLNWISSYFGEIPVGLKSVLLGVRAKTDDQNDAGENKHDVLIPVPIHQPSDEEEHGQSSASCSYSEINTAQENAPKAEPMISSSFCEDAIVPQVVDLRPSVTVDPGNGNAAASSTKENTGTMSSGSDTKKEYLSGGSLDDLTSDQRARIYWKAEFRRHSSQFAGISSNERSSKLNSLYDELSEPDKQEWKQYAEAKMRSLYDWSSKPIKPHFTLKPAGFGALENAGVAPCSLPLPESSLTRHHWSRSRRSPSNSVERNIGLPAPVLGARGDQREMKSIKKSSSGFELDSDDNVDVGPFVNLRRPTSSNARTMMEPLTTKHGRLINLTHRAQGAFRKELRNAFKDNGPNFSHLTKGKRKSKLNEYWAHLDQLQKNEWVQFVETKLRNKYEYIPPPNLPYSIVPRPFPPRHAARDFPQLVPFGVGNERKQRISLASNTKPSACVVAKEIPKPQIKFEFEIDNSVRPFVPILKWKPHSLEESCPVPYVPKRKFDPTGVEAEIYEHPYEAEILDWTPTAAQILSESSIIPKTLEPEKFDLVDTIEAVNKMLEHLNNASEIAIDLEHHNVRSYLGLTCLIQISTRTQDFIVDGLAMYRKLECLNQVFTNPRIIKVFHAAQSDILWLQRDFGVYVVGMFDTSIASEYLHGKSCSLKYLLETYIEQVKEVDKSFQTADWRIRPLTIEMLHYARMDTHYLLYLFDILKTKLKEAGNGKLMQVFMDSNAKCLAIYKKPDCKMSPKLMEFQASLSPRQKYAFEELFKWRDAVGRVEDESPVSYVIPNACLERLAWILPTNEAQLTGILKSSCNYSISPVIVKHMGTVLNIINSARQLSWVRDARGEVESGVCEEDWDLEAGGYNCISSNSNFRDMAAIPSVEELFAENDNVLEKNVTVGPYLSSDHYLSTHFQLIREDFIRSVKPGLKALKEGRPGKWSGIKVHTNIRIVSMEKNKWKICLPYHLRSIANRDDARRFLPGSLLLFTDNNFGDTYIGLICQPYTKLAMEEAKMGIFPVLLRGEFPAIPWEEGVPFLTIECDAYFEPYRCVMTALKLNTWLDYLPIAEYLLNPKFVGEIRPPQYLLSADHFNVGTSSVNFSDLSKWPSALELGFDDAQFKAYQAALTQELVIIQGPPGTGKTYLGLRILETLMQEANMALWRGQYGEGGPIVIVCYTNHALDQFGEGILNLFTPPNERGSEIPYEVTYPRILRLGTGCHSPRLRNYQPDFETRIKFQLNEADILLMTTTGGAIRHRQLSKLNSKILIVEEAAEVFESHIMGCLTPSLEHLILLGDHQQLRPLTATRELTESYGLDVSLFERLASLNRFPKHQLRIQHRMRPSIRDLITGPHMYPVLMDHESVTRYPPNVAGMERPLFFIDHRVQETQLDEDETSKSNPFEVEYLGYLCTYLLRAGHPPSSIAVLGMYGCQVRLLQAEIWRRRGISTLLRIETLDSFQGEENEIILLSLVRSNWNGDIGFMREDNRICVAMSRAKQGFYMIGNMELLAGASPTWKIICQKLRQNGNIGPVLNLCCDKHVPKVIRPIGTFLDFQNVMLTPCQGCLNFSRQFYDYQTTDTQVRRGSRQVELRPPGCETDSS